MEQSVRQRKFGNVVRVTVDETMPARMREILIVNLEIERQDLYTVPETAWLKRRNAAIPG